jgi:DNA-binding transcriptional regulator YiaG
MRKTQSAILEAVHETAQGLHNAGVMESVTMREFDRLCLPPIERLQPEEIEKMHTSSAEKRLRHRAEAHGEVFPSRLEPCEGSVKETERY